MRDVTAWFIVIAPIAILILDALIYWLDGYEATITAVVRGWSEESVWPEAVFLAGVLALYLHLYRGWP